MKNLKMIIGSIIVISFCVALLLFAFPKWVEVNGFNKVLIENGVDYNKNNQLSFVELYTYNGHLDLSKYSGDSLVFLRYMPNLGSLNISNINNINIKDLKHLKKLTYLEIQNMSITDLSVLKYLKNLKTLDASYNRHLKLDTIPAMSNIKDVRFIDCNLKNINFLSNFNNVETLMIQVNKIENTKIIIELKRLKTLGIDPDILDATTLDTLRKNNVKILSDN